MVGSETKVKVVKNKVAPPFKQASFEILYGEGVSLEGELIELGVNLGIVDKSGAWYSYQGDQLARARKMSVYFEGEYGHCCGYRGQDQRAGLS